MLYFQNLSIHVNRMKNGSNFIKIISKIYENQEKKYKITLYFTKHFSSLQFLTIYITLTYLKDRRNKQIVIHIKKFNKKQKKLKSTKYYARHKLKKCVEKGKNWLQFKCIISKIKIKK